MQSLLTLAIASMLLAGPVRADDSQVQESLQQLVEERNAAIALSLQRKVDILMDANLRDYMRSRPVSAAAELVIIDNALLAAR